MLYQLSYFRKNKPSKAAFRLSCWTSATPTGSSSGKRWIRTTEGVRQQIYSLPHLATLVSSQYFAVGLSPWHSRSRWRDSNPRPRDYKSRALANWATSAFQPLRDTKVGIFFIFANFSEDFLHLPCIFLQIPPYFARSKNSDYRFAKPKSENRVQI